MSQSLFEKLSGENQRLVKIAILPGQMIYSESQGHEVPFPVMGADPIVFEVHQISANQLLEADNILARELPPAKFEEQAKGGHGMTKVHVGYDDEDPRYIAKRQALVPLRWGILCIHGCPGLRDSTPGNSAEEKARSLMDSIPALLLEWIAGQIERLTVFTAVGEEDVNRFFQIGSEGSDTKSSSDSEPRSQPIKAQRSGKRSTGKDSTQRTSNTKSAKRRASGG